MHSTGMTWIQLWNSPVKIIPLILPEVPSHTDKGLSAKPGLEKRVQKNSKASPMFTMAMIVTGYPGIRDCLNAYRDVRGCDFGNLKRIRLNAKIHTGKLWREKTAQFSI